MPTKCFVLASAIAFCGAMALAAEPPSADAPLSFEQHIRPILKAHCFRCHGGEEDAKAGLDLRLRRFMVAGGDSGPAIVPGHSSDSLLLARIQSGEMPPVDKKLSPAEIALIARWLDAGATTARPEPEKLDPGLEITPEERSFWAFQPIPAQVPVPTAEAGAEVRTPIDAFLAAALRKAGLSFSPAADKASLLVRATFDLTGLPPTRDDMAAYLADSDPAAYERAIDRLLDSPHYGERWARRWLDVAGYADSDGYTATDSPRAFAYQYRDYVIRALNADKPWNEFITEQLAGDELATTDLRHLSDRDKELLAATGFLRMAADGTATGGIDQDVARNQVMADTLKIVSTSLLALSVGCAQCHDHRYDPIPQADYYRLRAVFEPALDWKRWRTPGERLVSLWTDQERAKAAEIDAQVAQVAAERQAKQDVYMDEALTAELAKYDDELQGALRLAYKTPAKQLTPAQQALLDVHPAVKTLSPGVLYQYLPAATEELKKIDARIGALQATKPPQEFLSVLNETAGELPKTMLFHRGDHQQPKSEILPGGLSVCAKPGERLQIAAKDAARASSGRRLALAKWLTGEDNPLTARVLVNRIWMHHFGRGLVNTPGDFGALGEKPSHPELLDWLARDFISGGWKLKQLHRQIMLSTAYRQSSARDAGKAERDPENRLLWRMPVTRLDAETLRDRILATSGVLSPRMFGPPASVKEDTVGQVVVEAAAPVEADKAAGHEAFRRSIYVQVRRSLPLAMLHAFDQPVMVTNCERRDVSTVATQSLMLMNSEFVLQQSGYFAARIRQLAPTDPKAQVDTAWQLAFGRAPRTEELEHALAFIAQQTQPTAPPAPATTAAAGAAPAQPAAPAEPPIDALANLCQILLSTNEFLYVE